MTKNDEMVQIDTNILFSLQSKIGSAAVIVFEHVILLRIKIDLSFFLLSSADHISHTIVA